MERSHSMSNATLQCDASGYADAGVASRKKPRKSRSRKIAATASAAIAAAAAAAAAEPLPDAGAPPLVEPAAASDSPAARMPADEVYQRIGLLTRTLHDALRELGYDKELAGTREQLPDARDRLAYIARVTGEAAEKVLNAVDRARSVQEELTAKATSLRTRWQAVAAYTRNDEARATPAGRSLVDETCEFFAGVGGQTDATQAILTDIMMAQDFHDLTGQVIRKVVALAQSMEEQLLKLLLQTSPAEQRRKLEAEKLEGPVVKHEGRDDVVADQAGVDDLLASLGF
jgi:chemotaxis protein CheZ